MIYIYIVFRLIIIAFGLYIIFSDFPDWLRW